MTDSNANYFLLDLDHTISISTERNIFFVTEPKNYAAGQAGIMDDIPFDPVLVISKLLIENGYECVVLTARSKSALLNSKNWLAKFQIDCEHIFMREDEDYRPDYIVKEELLKEIREKFGEPFVAFDDRPDVLEMYKRNKIPTLGVSINR